MTPEEHYREAERWLAESADAPDEVGATLALRTAQVHATLATASTATHYEVCDDGLTDRNQLERLGRSLNAARLRGPA
jgi:hypothetical protein